MTPWDKDKVRGMFLSPEGSYVHPDTGEPLAKSKGGIWKPSPMRTKTLQEYHDFLEENLNLEVLDPQRTLTFKLVMGKSLPSEVADLLNVRSGLDSLSYSLGADGFSLDLNFNNKPPALMELGVGMRDMGPSLNSLASIR